MGFKKVNPDIEMFIGYKEEKDGKKVNRFADGELIIEGKYAGAFPNKFNPEKPHHKFLTSEGKLVVLNSAGHLDYLVSSYLNEGDLCQVLYGGEHKVTKGPMKDKMAHRFELLLDDSAVENKVKNSNNDDDPSSIGTEDI